MGGGGSPTESSLLEFPGWGLGRGSCPELREEKFKVLQAREIDLIWEQNDLRERKWRETVGKAQNRGQSPRERGGTETQRERERDPETGGDGRWSPRQPCGQAFTPPQSCFQGKADTCLGGVGVGRDPIPLPPPKYSMARWQEGCPPTRVSPLLLPITARATQKAAAVVYWGGGGALPRLWVSTGVTSLTHHTLPHP